VSKVCDREASTERGGPGPYKAVEPYKKNGLVSVVIYQCLLLSSIIIDQYLLPSMVAVFQLSRARAYCGSPSYNTQVSCRFV
jgi:hypothetical protein